jgi:hypothetical protein
VQRGDDPRWLCRFDADVRVLDLRQEEVRRSVGVTIERLVAPWAPGRANAACLRVAREARRLGADGIVVPSAARPDAWNIDIWPPSFERLRLVSRRRRTPRPPVGGLVG